MSIGCESRATREHRLLEGHARINKLDESENSIEEEIRAAKLRQLYRHPSKEFSERFNEFAAKVKKTRINSLKVDGKRKHYNVDAAAEQVAGRAVEKVAWLAYQGVDVEKI